MNGLVYFLLVGLVAGFLGGQIMRGRGFGAIGNIVVGIIGAFVGGFLSNALGISLGGGTLGAILAATFGAVILLLGVGILKSA